MGTNLRLDQILLASLAVVAGCTGDSQPEPSTVFVGQDIAVVTGANGDAVIYLCDGVQTSEWFIGTANGNAITAQADDGATLSATRSGNTVSGSLQLPGQSPRQFSASLASGVAGLYLVQQSAAHAEGFSATGGELDADLAGAAATGTVRADGRDPLALTGNVKAFGEPTGVATWIVQADGSVSGKVTNTAGGGNCSIWSKMKQVMFGVDCSFF